MDYDPSAQAAYRALEPGQIRLLRLTSLSDGNPDESDLQVDFIVGSPRSWNYVAISHTWAYQSFDEKLNHRDGILTVTRSCMGALKAFHRRYGNALVWIDQACINQFSPAEKSSQILLMGDIYAHASLVVVWLGPLRQWSSQERIRLLSQASPSDHYRWDQAYRVRHTTKPLQGHNLPFEPSHETTVSISQRSFNASGLVREICSYYFPNSQDPSDVTLLQDPFAWQTLADILGHRYFRRRWVLQESALAQTARCVVLADGVYIPLYMLRQLVWFPLYYVSSTETSALPGLRSRLQQLRRDHLPELQNMLVVDSVYKQARFARPRCLVWYLWNCQGFRVSVRKDHFYAIRNLASNKDVFPEPDYSLGFETVMLQHLERCITLEGTPFLISTAGLTYVNNVTPLDRLAPSWLPSWFYAASELSDRPPSAPLPLLELSRTHAVTDNLTARCLELVSAGGAAELGSVSLSSDCLQLSVKVCIVGKISNIARGSEMTDVTCFKDYITFAQQHARFDTFQMKPNVDFDLLDTSWSESGERPGSTLTDHFRFEAVLEMLFLPRRTDESGEFVIMEDERELMHARELKMRRLAATGDGRFCFVPDCALVGDAVTIIPGCKFPMLLRAQGTNEYQVVGDIYVNGLMQGEALKLPSYKLEEIVLV